MLKKLILASALSLPFVITTGPANAFEFPDKPPSVSYLQMLVITQTTFGEVKNKLVVCLFKVDLTIL